MRNFFSHRTREILWIIMFAVLSSGASPPLSIVIPPEDVTRKVGETAVFTCEIDFKDFEELAWTFKRKIIYSYLHGNEDYPMGRERYSVTQDGRTFKLSIKDLQYSDGGEYSCDVPSQASAAHLIVIGAPLRHSFVIPPEDVIGKVGETAVFKCKVDSKDLEEMAWTLNRKMIYSYLHGDEDYPMGRERYSVTQDGRTFELSIKDLHYSDGGKYACDVPSQASAAHLVVIGSPHLSNLTLTPYPVEGSMAKFSCTAEYGGPSKDDIPPGQYPKLQMFLDGTPLDDTFKEARLEVTTSSYKLTQIRYITLKPDMDGKLLMCKIGTSRPDVHETVMIRMNVQYWVRNIRYTPDSDEHKVGTTINCTADGNPQPNFFWTDTGNKANIILGPSLRITEKMVGSNAWRCTATNTISEFIHEQTLVAVFQAVTEEEGQTSPVHKEEGQTRSDSRKHIVGLITAASCVLFGCVIALTTMLFLILKKNI